MRYRFIRTGAVRDAIVAQQRDWLAALERLAREAVELGELDPGADPAQPAFEVKALLVAANTSFILLGDAGGFERARQAIAERLHTAPPSPTRTTAASATNRSRSGRV